MASIASWMKVWICEFVCALGGARRVSGGEAWRGGSMGEDPLSGIVGAVLIIQSE